MSIHDDLKQAVEKYRRLARRNYYFVYGLYVIAVAASVLSTILAFAKTLEGPYLAGITAIPGIVLLILQTFRLSERAAWHYEKKNQLNGLLRLALTKASGTSEPEIAEKWNKIDIILEKSWPTFGGLGKISRTHL